jgi:hypothetical protein
MPPVPHCAKALLATFDSNEILTMEVKRLQTEETVYKPHGCPHSFYYIVETAWEMRGDLEPAIH